MKDAGTEPTTSYPLFKALEQIERGSAKVFVKGEGKDAEIVVISGVVVEVKTEMTDASSLVNLFLNTGLVSKKTIKKVSESKEAQTMPLLDALVSMGFIPQSIVTEAQGFVCYEALVDLLLHEDVLVTIEEVQSPINREMCSIPVRFVLRDARRRIEEWPQIVRLVSHESMVFAKTHTLSGRLGIKQWAEMPLEPQDRQVFVYVNGRRSVREISRLTGQTIFRVSKALKDFLDLGLIRQVEKPLPETDGERNRIKYFSALALVIMVLSLLVQPLLTRFVFTKNEVIVSQEEVFRSVHRETLILCLDAFRLLNGSDPKSVTDTRNIGILKRCKTLGE
jgi:hypothetical protein